MNTDACVTVNHESSTSNRNHDAQHVPTAVAVKKHKLSFYFGETLFMTIYIYVCVYIHSGNLT